MVARLTPGPPRVGIVFSAAMTAPGRLKRLTTLLADLQSRSTVFDIEEFQSAAGDLDLLVRPHRPRTSARQNADSTNTILRP